MLKNSFFATAAAAAMSAALCAAQTAPPAPLARRAQVRLVTREVSLGRIHPGEVRETRTLSPNRRRVAFVAKVAGGEAVFVDGVAGKTYPSVESDPLSEAGPGSPITFSPDGRRFAYVAYVGPPGAGARGPRLVVVDGKEGAPFDYVWSGSPNFSPDGRRFAYTAERGGKWHAVVDGVESKAFDRVAQPAFSKDGARATFSAERGGRRLIVVDGVEFDADDPAGPTQSQGASAPREVAQGDRRFVVWGGGRGGPYTEVRDLDLSAAGERVTYSAKRDGKEFAVVDGKEGKPYDDVGDVHVSPDGKRVMYVARLGAKWLAVLDGAEGAKYDQIEIEYPSPFSPDGRRYAYKAAREVGPDSREYFAVADGKEGKPYDHITHVTFTPDGAHLLYLAYKFSDRKTFLVRDGEEVASYDNTPGYSGFRFSGPDGKRMFFRLNKLGEGKETLVLDGRAFSYDEIKNAEFGPGGRRFIFKARRGQGWVMVLDGAESEVYEADGGAPGEVEWGGEGEMAFSRDGGRVAYVARKAGKDFVVVDGAAGARYDDIANLAFTPDGRHVVHTARRGGKSLVIVDGVEGREYDGFVPAGKHERKGQLNVEGDRKLSVLAARGAELLLVEIEIAD